MDAYIHDGFLDSQWIPGFMLDSWMHDGFLDSQWIPRFTMDFWKPHTSDYVASGVFFCCFCIKMPFPICFKALHV